MSQAALAPAVAPRDAIGAILDSEAKLRILLVEDDPGDATLMRLALAEELRGRFALSTVESLAAALGMLAIETYDVVLLDLNLPDAFGMTTLARMQAAAPTLPIVVMTGLDDPAFADHALQAGAQDYLVKGNDAGGTVVRAIRYAITRKHAEVERQELFDRLTEERNKVQAELDAARAMQFDLLPRCPKMKAQLDSVGLRVESHFQPSSSIGGDLWGLLNAGSGRVTVYSFDFAGHGVSAALNVFRLHTLMGHHADLADDPALLLHSLNQALVELLPRGQFATMFAGCIDTAADTLTWSGAGAPPPFLVTEHQLQRLNTRGLPLGMSGGAEYTAHASPFPAGVALFLYSDAFTEAHDRAGRPFGEDRLAAHVGLSMGRTGGVVQDILERFLDAVVQPLEDDLTAVWVGRIGGVVDGISDH
ncbi:PP2C family protein-serine/threonine phosphatase [Magnetospirillum sp. UT-4]|uniref:PP2C family protein-serine/threonine phosphatase n=1 Tax=Magnetospirillum sp. UT-4 TaxID=2681467 RepID=UPI001381B66B|nr:fused response regulator/phosphatase [Magnetospirillum sp. UT-4]CAA7618678.1 conserved hypothetical protein [Magnetospirillum sp. UT-4]